jgi:hypothetical protein
LASDDASYVTGTLLFVDGGMTVLFALLGDRQVVIAVLSGASCSNVQRWPCAPSAGDGADIVSGFGRLGLCAPPAQDGRSWGHVGK